MELLERKLEWGLMRKSAAIWLEQEYSGPEGTAGHGEGRNLLELEADGNFFVL
jgi:hypothetical protein